MYFSNLVILTLRGSGFIFCAPLKWLRVYWADVSRRRERSNENHLVFSNLPLFARGSTSLYLNTMMSHSFLLNRTRCSGRCTPENVDSIVLPSQCSGRVNRRVLDRLHFQSFSEGFDVGFDGSFCDVLAYRLLRRARSDYGCCPYERSEHHHVRV